MPDAEPAMERPWYRHYDAGVPRTVDPPRATMVDVFRETVARYGSHPGMVFMGRKATFDELWVESARAAALFRALGVRPHDRVALLIPNVPQFVHCCYGAMMAGAVIVSINPLGMKRDVATAIRDSGARVLVALDVLLGKFWGELELAGIEHVLIVRMASLLPPLMSLGFRLEALVGKVELPPRNAGRDYLRLAGEMTPLREPEPLGPDDVTYFQYTGGTTGSPKAAMLTNRNLVVNSEQCRVWLGTKVGGGDVGLMAVPFFHVYGMTVGMNLSIRTAMTMILHPRFNAVAAMRDIQRHRVTVFPGVQVFYKAIGDHPRAGDYDLKSVSACISGAGPLMKEVQDRFEARTGARLAEGYGLTEASPVTHCNPLRGTRKPGTIGVPAPSTDARITDLETGERELPPGSEGELCVKGPQVMKGYWGREDETRAVLRGGWLHTGDIAVMDEDGFFRIVDRKKEMIKSAGENVYPRNVEEVLYLHPSVSDAAVIGVPDPRAGEMVKAFVILRPGARVTGPQLVEFCRSHLSRAQIPREIEFRSTLPRNQMGKLLRRVLAAEERAKAEGGRGA
jgi:long-chain acyl-CoA synthetase